eukprot:12922325-Prorocentrum_lima.AAC.1
MKDEDHGLMRCVQCPTYKNVWKVVSNRCREIVGFFMVYVDDVIMFGATSTVKRIIEAFQKEWKCR